MNNLPNPKFCLIQGTVRTFQKLSSYKILEGIRLSKSFVLTNKQNSNSLLKNTNFTKMYSVYEDCPGW
jgi:hypothetical protein